MIREDGDDEGQSPAGEECEPVRKAPWIHQPSQKEVEDHNTTHYPYRVWCKFCRMGKALGEQHRRVLHESEVPIVAMDYFFITEAGEAVWRRDLHERGYEAGPNGDEKVAEARRNGTLVKCLMVKCLKSKAIWAHVVPVKGHDEDGYAADLVTKDVAWLGHTKIIIKTDNEPALGRLVRAAMVSMRVTIAELEAVSNEHSPEYDSQANGSVENAIRNFRAQFRTVRLCLEARLNKKLPITHALIPWIVEHVSLLMNAVPRGSDGRTPWQRIKGRAFNQTMYEFGEMIMYKYPTKGPAHHPDANMGSRLGGGVFLGYKRDSNQYLVGVDTGVTSARSILRNPQADRWPETAITSVKATPWSLHERVQRVVLEQPAEEQHDEARQEPTTNFRRLKIVKQDLTDFGYTEGCSQCDHYLRYGLRRPGFTHSEACRQRIMNELGKTDTGRVRLEALEERVDRALADHIERNDNREAQPAAEAVHEPRPAAAHDEMVARVPPVVPAERDWPRMAAGESWADAADADDAAVPMDGLPGDAAQGEPMDSEVPRDQDEMDVANIAITDTAEQKADDETSIEDLGGGGDGHEHDLEVFLMQQLGGHGRPYRRDRKRGFDRLVSEVYSPARITRELQKCPRKGLGAGVAMDLTTLDPLDNTPWNFDLKAKRDRARDLVKAQKPILLVCSVMCTAFCTWQALNAVRHCRSQQARREYIRAMVHLRFVCELCELQASEGRFFLHEHPTSARSWGEECVQLVENMEGVQKTTIDQCQYGQQVLRGPDAGAPVKKSTSFLTNCAGIADALRRRCSGRGGACSRRRGGRHVHCAGNVAKDAAIYPRGLCKAVLDGLCRQLQRDGAMECGVFGVDVAHERDGVQSQGELPPGGAPGCSGRFRDDLTGQPLRDDFVKAARETELQFFKDKGVWTKRLKAEARTVTGRLPISVRWVDVNKGDDEAPNYRSRLVARQMKALDRSDDSFFAPTPPLEGLRTVLSLTTTTIPGIHQPCYEPNSEKRVQISTVDVKRAYFNAKVDADEPTYVDLPPEDPDCQGMCARLDRHMYGTRGAADGWQQEYSSTMVKVLKFRQGLATPCAFYHPSRQLVCCVHGDDFTTSGPKHQLDWFEREAVRTLAQRVRFGGRELHRHARPQADEGAGNPGHRSGCQAAHRLSWRSSQGQLPLSRPP